MATVLAFPERRVGDWTEAERARLNELAGRFADEAGVEVVFGRTDADDPWCVVLDARDEVLVHVARVNGTFVAHTLPGDAFAESRDLKTVVESVLGPKWQDDRDGVVVPFALSARHAQVVTAVLLVAAFVDHHRAEAATEEWALATVRLAKSPATNGKAGQRDEAAKAAAAALPDPSPLDRPAPTASSEAAPLADHDFSGTTGARSRSADDRPTTPKIHLDLSALLFDEPDATVVGPPVASIGTDGPDLLGAPRSMPAPARLLDGGGGDDLLHLDGGTVAIGGGGADRFVVDAAVGDAPRLLGVVLDFDPGRDVVAVDGAPAFSIVSRGPVANVLAAPAVSVVGLPSVAGERVGIDVDGDGREDGFFLVANAPEAVNRTVRNAFLGAADAGPADADRNGGFDLAPAAEPTMILPADNVA